MTPAQTKLYWREWAAAWRAIREAEPMLTSADADRERHAIHRRALGYSASSRTFSNSQFDRVLAAMRAISRPADVKAQLRQQAQPRSRKLWLIDNELLPELGRRIPADVDPDDYLLSLLKDRFHTDDFRALPDRDLQHLVVTLQRCIAALPPPGSAVPDNDLIPF